MIFVLMIHILLFSTRANLCLYGVPNQTESASVTTNNVGGGVQFDVTAKTSCVSIQRFWSAIRCAGNVSVYMNPNPGAVGTTSDVSGFRRIATAMISSGSQSGLVVIPVWLNLTVKQGETRSFAILTSGGCMHYQNTDALNTSIAEDDFIRVQGGRGLSSLFDASMSVLGSGSTFANREARLRVEYSSGIFATVNPTSVPSTSQTLPSRVPSLVPSNAPTVSPTKLPSSQPTNGPTLYSTAILNTHETCGVLISNQTESSFTSNNQAAGVQFDVTSKTSCIHIERFWTKIDCFGRFVSLYMNPNLGSVGSTSDVTGFERIGNRTIVNGSTSGFALVPIFVNVTLKAGETKSFAIVTDNDCMKYENTLALNAVLAEDDFVRVQGGRGLSSTHHTADQVVLGIGGVFNNRGARIRVEYSSGIVLTKSPTDAPTFRPTVVPTSGPSIVPTSPPTKTPSSVPTSVPTTIPSNEPSTVPTLNPTNLPTPHPSGSPSLVPTISPSVVPTTNPTVIPSSDPTTIPTAVPTFTPSKTPSLAPTALPTDVPTNTPSIIPSATPTINPTSVPTSEPTIVPSLSPTTSPSGIPTTSPSVVPSTHPTLSPTSLPTGNPSTLPSSMPSVNPTLVPTMSPTSSPFAHPTGIPSGTPTLAPTNNPTAIPTSSPFIMPTNSPTSIPTTVPSRLPSSLPSHSPSTSPTLLPSQAPSDFPTKDPTVLPTGIPSFFPSPPPSISPTIVPSKFPTQSPTSSPTRQWFANETRSFQLNLTLSNNVTTSSQLIRNSTLQNQMTSAMFQASQDIMRNQSMPVPTSNDVRFRLDTVNGRNVSRRRRLVGRYTMNILMRVTAVQSIWTERLSNVSEAMVSRFLTRLRNLWNDSSLTVTTNGKTKVTLDTPVLIIETQSPEQQQEETVSTFLGPILLITISTTITILFTTLNFFFFALSKRPDSRNKELVIWIFLVFNTYTDIAFAWFLTSYHTGLFVISLLFLVMPFVTSFIGFYRYVSDMKKSPQFQKYLETYKYRLPIISFLCGSTFNAHYLLNSNAFEWDIFEMNEMEFVVKKRFWYVVVFEDFGMFVVWCGYLMLGGSLNVVVVCVVIGSVVSFIVEIVNCVYGINREIEGIHESTKTGLSQANITRQNSETSIEGEGEGEVTAMSSTQRSEVEMADFQRMKDWEDL